MDGATTLTEAASKLREFADYLEELEKKGYQLNDAVEDDYGFISKAKSKTKSYHVLTVLKQ